MGEIATQQARGLALQTISDAMTFGKMVAGSDFAPKDFRGKPESCVLAMQHGAELGLSPMQAIQSIAVVNGRPSVYGDTAKGNRPSWGAAAPGEIAKPLWEDLCDALGAKRGVFGAMMDVVLVNDGPVTLTLEEPPPAA
jgi:hypothetical protein